MRNGFQATATRLQTHGLPDGEKSWNFNVIWKLFNYRDGCYVADYGWRIYVAPSVEERLTAILAKLLAGKTYLDDYTRQGAGTVPTGTETGLRVLKCRTVAKEIHDFIFDPPD